MLNNGDLNGSPVVQIARLQEWRKGVIQQMENTNEELKQIRDKIDCKVHSERINNLKLAITGLYVYMTVVVVSGIILGLWIKSVMN